MLKLCFQMRVLKNIRLEKVLGPSEVKVLHRFPMSCIFRSVTLGKVRLRYLPKLILINLTNEIGIKRRQRVGDVSKIQLVRK